MRNGRRDFLKRAGLAALAGTALEGRPLARAVAGQDAGAVTPPIKPPRLRPGATVGVCSPSGITREEVQVEIVEETLDALGLRMKLAPHALDRWGYLAGQDEDRAADLNALFADDGVDAVFALRGGWGAARMLPHVDFEVVRANPKIFMGYSDITALLLSIYARASVVTFHGPNAGSPWNGFTADHVRPILFDAEAPTLSNPVRKGDYLAQLGDRIRTITPGSARGRLAGGNLTVLTAIVGSGYLPDLADHVLFLEDVNEDVYRVDRMLTQLRLAGILDGVAGIVFGKCTDCDPGSGYSSFTLQEVLEDHFRSLGVPAFRGSMIGHVQDKFTLPVGVEVAIDADAGTIRLLEPAVT